MSKVFLQKIIITFFAISYSWILIGQDLHLSQPYFSPLNLSPGMTGLIDEDIRFAGSYRSQWQSVPVPYLTFSGSADMKLPMVFKNNERLALAGGVLFNYDKAGDSDLTLSSFGLSGALHFKPNDRNTLSLGIQSMAVQRSFSLANLQFNNQYNGDIFDPSRDTKENFNNESKAFVDISGGLSWMFRVPKTRHVGHAGIGYFHLNNPLQSFKDADDSRLESKLVVYSGGIVQIHSKWDVIIHALGQLQEPYGQLLVTVGGRYHLSQARGKEIAIQFGTGFRVNDAIIPTIELHYAAWKFGLSYDINISKFETATNGRGGIELGAIYTITKVKPIDVFESCPVF